MVTRRTALGAGMALATVVSAGGLAAYGPIARQRGEDGSIDALLIDDSIDMPGDVGAIIKARKAPPSVVSIRLDAAAQAGLRRVLQQSQAIVGVSSGATLFCLERIAWDYGFRLTARTQRPSLDLGNKAFLMDVAGFLDGAGQPATNPSALVRAYRPSRADAATGTLHAWTMQKSDGSQLHQRRKEA